MDTRPRSTNTAMPVARTTRRREIEHDGLIWVDVPQPTNADFHYLRERFKIDSLLLDDLLATIQRPHLDVRPADEHLFLALHMPSTDRENHVLISELDMLVGRDVVVSIHDGTQKPVRRLFAAASSDEAARLQLLGRGSGFLLSKIIDAQVKSCYQQTFRIAEDLDKLEIAAFGNKTSGVQRTLAGQRRDVVLLQQMYKANTIALGNLRAANLPFLRTESARAFGNSAQSMARLYDMAEEQGAVAAGIGDILRNQVGERANALSRWVLVLLAALIPLVLLAAAGGAVAIGGLLGGNQLLAPGIVLLTIVAAIGAAAWVWSNKQLS